MQAARLAIDKVAAGGLEDFDPRHTHRGEAVRHTYGA